VTAVVKGGLLVDVMGLRGFVPSSHLRVKNSLEQMVNTTLPLKILSLDQQRNNIILSHRKVMSEQMAEQRKELFSNLSVGTVVEGEVVRLTEFGAFVDLGGVDGLLPLSQMSWRWVEHPSDILKIGDSVKVEVIGVDHDKQRVSLSIKSQFSDPWNDVAKELKAGDQVEGGITRIKHFGAFVEIYPGVEALLPSKDLNDYEHQKQAKLEVGQKINTYIIKFTPEERRISLSFNPPFHMQQQMQQPQVSITGD
jgi:ribosomal protein S1